MKEDLLLCMLLLERINTSVDTQKLAGSLLDYVYTCESIDKKTTSLGYNPVHFPINESIEGDCLHCGLLAKLFSKLTVRRSLQRLQT